MNVLGYRTRTAAERRQRMRSHLIRTAMSLYAGHGMVGLTIDEVIRHARVARGTFYNYFRTSEELLAVVAATLSDELMQVVDPLVNQLEDSAARISRGVRTCLLLGEQYPLLAAFVSHGGPAALESSALLRDYLPRDLAAGMACGRFSVSDPQLAFDLVVGPVLAGYHAIVAGKTSPDYIDNLAMAVLQSLGVPRSSAQKISRQPLPDIVPLPDSILFTDYTLLQEKNA